MSFWHKVLLIDQQHNEQKNQIACIENDFVCKSNDQLLTALQQATDIDIIKGIKNVLLSRGFSRKELVSYLPSQFHNH
ncbi:hypothetical protein [Acinetobacter larvae]|uniref:Uncharacterized protein n=1 Tax=Acinetobacter larvae TaxID=1789224 RepID=A0A1B2M0M3_9GAMM|nr:hypothetical protein [Acinetobacter larvae]AOA58754.1 hypothetical protein BFG52_10605 [Acinetobacter larvae]